MAVSYASVDSTVMELTPMRVSFQGPGATAFTDLGGTLSNVVVDIKYPKAEIKADQLGSDTVLDRRVKGMVVTVTTELTQIQNKAQWEVAFPHSLGGGTSPADWVQFNSAVGDGDLANAGILKLHPLSKADADVNYDYYFYKACASAESQVTYGPDNQATLKIVWNVLPDTSVTPARFFVYGDETLVP
jgi:hypothetical protein